MKSAVIQSLSTLLRLVTFRLTKEQFANLNRMDLYVGLFFTWIVGMGRYWDDPGARLLQHLGVGSVIYIFVLSALIWGLLLPWKISDWRYERVLTFVSLTSLPAIFYAIPVERFLEMNDAIAMNAYFLLAVAAWRVALLIFFLGRSAELSTFATTVGTFLPLVFIVSLLAQLNLERAVFEIMGGGMRERTSRDGAFMILNMITVISVLALGPLVISYGGICWWRRRPAAKGTK